MWCFNVAALVNPLFQQKNKLLFFEEEDDGLKCTTVDNNTQKISNVASFDTNEMKKFVEDIPKIIDFQVKTIFLNIPEYCPPGFSSSYEFRKELKQKFDDLKIPYYFFNEFQWYLSCTLISANYTSTVGDIVLFLKEFDDDDDISIIACKFTEKGYLQYRPWNISIKKSDEGIRKEISKYFNPKAFFFYNNSPTFERFKKIFKTKEIFVCEEEMDYVMPRILIELSKWFFDRSIVKYHIRPITFEKVKLCVKIGAVEYSLITFDENLILPLSTTKTFKKIVNNCRVTVKESADKAPKIFASWLPNQNAHQHKVTLSIDDQGFISYEIKAILWPHVKLLPKLLKRKIRFTSPVIAFFENLSFICVRKDAKSDYKYLASWNGEYGMDLYISFDEEKPKYCQNALEVAKTKPTFVVHNIFEMLFASPKVIKTLPNEQFKITEDKHNPVLIEFDNYDGTRKLATPQFLMAMLLKQHLKAIKAEIGQKPKKIIVTTFVDVDVKQANRLRNKLAEACKMLKISCDFVNSKDLL